MTFESQEPEHFHRFWHENEKPAEYPVRSPEVHVFLEQSSSSQSCLNGLRYSIISFCCQVVVDILSLPAACHNLLGCIEIMIFAGSYLK